MPLSLSFSYTPAALGSPSPPPSPPPLLLYPLPIPTRLLHIHHARKDSKFLSCSSLSLPPSSSPSSSPAAEVLPQNAIQRIAEKLRSLGYIEADAQEPPRAGPGTAGEIFIPTPRELPRRRVGHTLDPSWSTPDSPVPDPGSGAAIARFQELKVEVERQRRSASPREEIPMVAELVLPPEELKRLRGLGIRLTKRLKVGKAGITEGIVNGIHERWRHTELVKIKCEDLCRMNMKRTHEILERKTGGLVIWRSGSIIILYRGANYKYPYFTDSLLDNENKMSTWSGEENLSCNQVENSYNIDAESSSSFSLPVQSSLVRGVGTPQKVRFQLPGEAKLEEENDKLLDGLGPRFTDWWDYGPLPVDADMLPANVPGYRRPFRLLPFGVKPKLTDQEMTILRRLSRSVPCHFALGRNRNLQGLAASTIKLWEKCEIAKIAVKRGARNTNSDMMAEELKQLTGGILLSRDKDFIVFYRGKDFLPLAVSSAIEERRNNIMHAKDLRLTNASPGTNQFKVEPDAGGSSFENQYQVSSPQEVYISTGREVKQVKSPLESMGTKLSRALEKKMQAEKLLAEIEKSVKSSDRGVDKEAISEEERYMLRKVGLRMKPFLLLGRRGAFDGTVENMHLHWKYRELVKIISKNSTLEDVHTTARTLEAASGGILVAVERVNKGHAIIMYRGKNYRRPTQLRPKTLLTKKEAYQKYLENQRRESLKLHVLKLSQEIEHMKTKLTSGAKHAVSLGVEADVLDTSSMFNGQETVMDEYLTNNVEKVKNQNETEFRDIPPVDFVPEAQPVRDMVISQNDDEAYLDANSSESEEDDDNPTAQRDIEELPVAIDHQPCCGYPKDENLTNNVEKVNSQNETEFRDIPPVDFMPEAQPFRDMVITQNDDEAYLDGNSSEAEEGDNNPTAQTDIEKLPVAIDHQPCYGYPKNDDEAYLDGNSFEAEEGENNPTAQTYIEELPVAIDHQPCYGYPKDENLTNIAEKVNNQNETVLRDIPPVDFVPEARPVRDMVISQNDDEAYLDGNSSEAEEGDGDPTAQTDIEELPVAIDDQPCYGYPKEKSASLASMRVYGTPNYEALLHIESGEHGLKHEMGSDVGRSFKAIPLSNKERLILRKQALKMKKKPVLAVGKNNVVSGVAKAIKTHFRKYPLAIVNIKGIAKGTSVQEVVSKLERATGSVLVSREPSKIILYRGWGVEPISGRKDNMANAGKPSLTNEELSPELLNAIRIESGLQTTSVDDIPLD